MISLNKRQIDSAAKQISEHCLGMRARCIGRTLTSIYDEALRPLGLTGSQLTLLVAITRNERITPGDLGRALGIEKSTLSRNLNRMQKRELLSIQTGSDNRSQQLSITKQGAALLIEALPLWKNAQKETKLILGKEGSEALILAVNSLPEL